MASRAFFAGSPVVRTLHFMAEGAGSVPGGELRSFMLVMWPKSHRLPRADWVPTFEKVVCRTPVDQRCLHHLGAFLAHTDLGSFRPHHLSCSPWSLLLAALPAQKALSVCLYSTEPYLPHPTPLPQCSGLLQRPSQPLTLPLCIFFIISPSPSATPAPVLSNLRVETVVLMSPEFSTGSGLISRETVV